MNKEDFIFDHMDEEYSDYWFKVIGDTKKELTDKYNEHGCEEVAEVVYSIEEDIVGIKQLFLFNYQVVESTNKELKRLLIDLVSELPKSFEDENKLKSNIKE